VAANRFIGVNFIPDNPKMAAPPEFWLQQLHDFDADLVLLPSRMIPYAYVLGRRRRFSAGLTDKAIADVSNQQDTVMCLHYGLVPVTMIYQIGTVWNIDPILRSLKARDIWAHGGADKYADKLDDADATRDKKLKQSIRDDMWNRSGDAWRSYQARTGQRTRPTLGSTPGLKSRAGTANTNSASGSTVGSGRIITTFS
jgi:hypothetical protein